MAPGVYKAFVIDIACSPLAGRDHMIRFYAFSHYEWDVTQRASVSLSLVQHQPLFLVGFPSHLLLLALRPVVAQGWVKGECFPVTFVKRVIGLRRAAPVPPFLPRMSNNRRSEHSGLSPSSCFYSGVGVSPTSRASAIGHVLKDVFGRTVPVIMRPSRMTGLSALMTCPAGVCLCVSR